ncbi:hypothetical protein IMY05_010G0127900 [Salix suchowensis]|nr:hypothetical protein IMY05_010G0127900 [Salix suchowensis]
MPFCCFPFCCGKKSKSKHQTTVHLIYSTLPVDPGTMNTHVERGYGVERGQIPELRIYDGCALLDFHVTKSSKEKHQPVFNKNKSIFEGKKNLGKVNTQSIGIQSDPEGSSTEIPVKLCNNNSEIPGSKDLILRRGYRVKEPHVQQIPHAARATDYVQQEHNNFDTNNNVMVNDIREEMGPIDHLASSWMKFWRCSQHKEQFSKLW